MGGNVPLGYRVENRKLVVYEPEDETVRMIFRRFIEVGSATTLAQALVHDGFTKKSGQPIDKGFLSKLLNNRTYIGKVVHKGTVYPGEHQAIIDRTTWDRAHGILSESPRKRAARTRASTPALLKGLIFGPAGCAMTPTHTRRGDKLYRYYGSQAVLKHGRDACPVGRLSAAEIEGAVVVQVRGLLREPEIVIGTWRAAHTEIEGITEMEVRESLERLDPIWEELFPAEQARVIQLLVQRIDVAPDGVDIRLRIDGLSQLVRELAGVVDGVRRAV